MINSSNLSTVTVRACAPLPPAGTPILFKPCAIQDEDVWSRGSPTYDLRMYGTLMSGAKACVHLSDVRPYFEYDISAREPGWRLTQVNIERDPAATAQLTRDGIARMQALITELCGSINSVHDMHAIWKFPLQGFSLEKSMYIQVFFTSMRARNDCLRAVRKYIGDSAPGVGADLPLIHQFPNILAHDDTSFNNPAYFNAVARDAHFSTTDWNEIMPSARDMRSFHDASYYDFQVPLAGIRAARASPDAAEMLERMHDRIMIESWDIETAHESETGDIPGERDDYIITTISLVYSYHWQSTPIACYVLTLYESNPPNSESLIKARMQGMPITFVKCVDERDLLVTRARISARMMPDMRIAFNGSNFDWPLYNEKVKRTGACFEILGLMDMSFVPWDAADETKRRSMYERHFIPMRIKIDATSDHDCKQIAVLAGSIDLDLMPTMRRIHKKEEVKFAQSLNMYLGKANLPAKIDVHFKRMLRMLQRARALAAPGVIRACHCATRDSCTFCATRAARVREIDYEVVDPSQPMAQWVYRDGRDGSTPILRNAALEKCCACGARPLNMEDIETINTYCGIDSVRPLQLANKLSIIGDHREMASTTYTSLYDAFFRADGMRVVNFTGSFAREFNLAISAHSPSRPNVHYQGAHVFSPKLGFASNAEGRRRPCTALDFNSLYPSLMLTYNFSPDTIVTSETSADALAQMGYELFRIEPFEYDILSDDRRSVVGHGTTHGWTVRHGGVLAPHATTGNTPLDARPPTIHVDADGKEIRGRPALERECIGIFPHALRVLLNARKATRAQQGEKIKRLIAILEKVSGQTHIEADVLGLDDQIERMFTEASNAGRDAPEALRTEALALALDYRTLNSKQLAYKVLANTYYGQMGSSKSVCYTLIGAAGVTTAGRYNILRVAGLLRKMGYTIIYGDTDSVYTVAPDAVFAEIDAKWETGGYASLMDYWGAQVDAARVDIEKLRATVSAFLRADNGTMFLNMGYEEVGAPAIFLGKKKYLMRPHVGRVTFGATPMVRGLETVKQGCARILRTLGNAIIEDLLAIDDTTNPMDIVERYIRMFYAGTNTGASDASGAPRYDVSQFIQYKSYKPAKNNVMVLRFVERMRERHARLMQVDPVAAAQCVPPEAGDKFPYVIVARDAEVSLGGHCIKFKVGDKMEYPYAVTSGKHTIDYTHYMSGALISLFARFVSCDPRFAPSNDPDPAVRAKWAAILGPDGSVPDDVDYTPYDEYRQRRASAALAEICARLSPSNMSRIHAVARTQRAAIGAVCEVVSQAATDCGIYLDAHVVRLIVHDRMREICAGDIGSRVSDEAVETMTNLICEIACDKSRDAASSEAEGYERYAQGLMASFDPKLLSQRYSGSYYEEFIVKPLTKQRTTAMNIIRMTYAARLIGLYRAKRFDDTISGIVMNSLDEGLKGKAALMPAIGKNITFSPKSIELLRDLGQAMGTYADADASLRRAAKMRERFAV